MELGSLNGSFGACQDLPTLGDTLDRLVGLETSSTFP
jgi:hypothetical protein